MKRISCLFFVIVLNCLSIHSQTFSYKTHGNIANYFASTDDMKSFFNFQNGQVIAEIGAAKGENVGGFGLLLDSCTFYVQDIDAKVLNKGNWNKVYRKFSKAGMSSKHQFKLVLGKEKSTELPAASFDKIIMVSAFHEFTYMDEMVADIATKLKPGGMVYILETRCLIHKYYEPYETIGIMEKYGFHPVQRDATQRNGSDGLYMIGFGKE